MNSYFKRIYRQFVFCTTFILSFIQYQMFRIEHEYKRKEITFDLNFVLINTFVRNLKKFTFAPRKILKFIVWIYLLNSGKTRGKLGST